MGEAWVQFDFEAMLASRAATIAAGDLLPRPIALGDDP